MSRLTLLMGRVFNTPLMITRAKLDVIMGVLIPRLRGEELPMWQSISGSGYDVNNAGIAVIPIIGTLVRRASGMEAASGLTSYEAIAQQLNAALQNPAIKGILLDIDSPGGEASGVFDLADQIFQARAAKPIWAIANDQAFSAAYALAAAAEKIYVTRTSGVGSIGVIAMHRDQSQADAQNGYDYTAIFAGAHKNDLSPHEPLSDPARASLQSEIDRIYSMFVQSVARMRSLNVTKVQSTEAGLFFGNEAIAQGLADQTGTLADALNDLASQLQINPSPGLRLKENTMPVNAENPALPIAGEAPNLDYAASAESIKAEALAYATEVAELCALAGVADQTVAYLAARPPIEALRQTLLSKAAQTAEASTISNHLPLPAAAQTQPQINTAAIYAARNQPKKVE